MDSRSEIGCSKSRKCRFDKSVLHGQRIEAAPNVPSGHGPERRPGFAHLARLGARYRLAAEIVDADDLGLLKGISVNYFSGESVSRAEAREVGDAWAPFRSVATWYIWRSLDPLPVDY